MDDDLIVKLNVIAKVNFIMFGSKIFGFKLR